MSDLLERLVVFLRNSIAWVVVAVIVVLVGGVYFSREGSGVDPDIIRQTQAAAAVREEVPLSTRVNQLTLTPPVFALTEAAPTVALLGREEVRQFAAAATATSELSDFDWAAIQAVGRPNVEGCESNPNAWAGPAATTTLTASFAQLVRPTGLLIYQSYNPGYIEEVIIIDTFGERRVVYQGTPGPSTICPFVLVIPIQNADYPANKVIILLNQANSTGGINQIDAVELIGVRY